MSRSKIQHIIIFSQLLIAFFGFVSSAKALTVYVDQPKGVVRAGDTVLVKVVVDTGDKEINAVEGSIRLSDNVKIRGVETGGSVFSMWPVYPAYQNGVIHFAGGTPSGVFGNRIHIFSFAVTSVTTGEVTSHVYDASVYLADGKGTRVNVETRDSSFIINETSTSQRDDFTSLQKNDTTPPEKFIIEYTKDPSVYGGKAFISFGTTDKDSGVNRYEVTENGVVYTVNNGVYVLQDENNLPNIIVTAVDSAGNKRSVVHSVTSPDRTYAGILILVVIIFIIYYFYNRRKRYHAPTEI